MVLPAGAGIGVRVQLHVFQPAGYAAPMPERTIGELAETETADAADLLARAFCDNPLTVAVLGSDASRRLRANRLTMRAALRTAREGSLRLTARNDGNPAGDPGGPSGVLVATPPGRLPAAAPSLLTQLWSVLGQGLRAARRWGEVYAALEDVHPVSPHWYLSLLGVDPARRRCGLGSALLACWLASVDRDAQPSYLETDREANLALYSRAGFEVTLELSVVGVPVWCMWRPARDPSGEYPNE